MCEEGMLLREKPASEGKSKEKGQSRNRNICIDKRGCRHKVGRIQASAVRSTELMQWYCRETSIRWVLLRHLLLV